MCYNYIMTSPDLPYLHYYLPGLNPLKLGNLDLGVPIVGNALQVGITGDFVKTRVDITVAHPEIKIARQDGSPLYIDEVVYGRRRSILAGPIAQLALDQADDEGVWAVRQSGELRVCDDEALGRFLGVVESFAVDKELKQQKNREAAAARRLLDTFLE
jgi:hypothetical protein